MSQGELAPRILASLEENASFDLFLSYEDPFFEARLETEEPDEIDFSDEL